MNDSIIKAGNINHSIASKKILKNINLDFDRDNITGIIGPSGSGKTTILRLLNRLISPDSGSILFNNKDYKIICPKYLRKQIGLVTQHPFLFKGTVEYNILYGPVIWGDTLKSSELKEILIKVGLENSFLSREISTLSGGEQQRVNPARTLANKPKVILLDEPTSHLDIISEEIIENTMKSLSNNGIKIIIVTHSLEQTKRITENIIFIKDGEVLEKSGTKEYFKKNNPDSIKGFFKNKS